MKNVLVTADKTKELVKRIEIRLIELDIRKLEFYRGCGINNATFSYWRNGAYGATAEKVEAVARFLGTTVEELTDGLT